MQHSDEQWEKVRNIVRPADFSVSAYDWQWKCSLRSRPGPSAEEMESRFAQWVAELRHALGDGAFGLFGVLHDTGPVETWHYEILVAGLKPEADTQRARWIARWEEIGGEAKIEASNAGLAETMFQRALASESDRVVIGFENDDAGLDAEFVLQVGSATARPK